MSEKKLDWISPLLSRMDERGLSQAQVEHDAGLGQGYLRKLLSGRKEPRLPTLERLLSVVDLSLDLIAAPSRETHHELR